MSTVVSPQASKTGFGLSLIVVAAAQLMLVLDDTIANIALPSIQRELAVSAATLPWIINAYVLAFGSLLLFGGRIGDLFGRRRVLRFGILIFTLASLLGAVGPNAELLVAARGLQGVGGALIAPNVLALITTNFPQGKSRNSAMAVYAAMSAVGMTVGILLGGILTGLLSWRWVFLINVPIGLSVLAGTGILVDGPRNIGRLDLPGAVSGTGAMVALTYGVSRAGEQGWSDALTVGAFIFSGVLGSLFLLVQSRSKNPLLPLSLLRDRNRSGSYAAVLFIGGGLLATYYLLTLYMQQVLQFNPVMAGLASLPVSVGIVLSAGISSKLVESFSPRAVTVPGLLIAAMGTYWLSTLTVGSSYAAHVLPTLFVTYFGLGMGFMPMTLTAVRAVADGQAGIASALLNSAQQIGAALGVAVLATISTAAANSRVPEAAEVLQEALKHGNAGVVATASEALTYGYTTAFVAGTGMLLIAAVVVIAAVNTGLTQGSGLGDGWHRTR
ncbi:MFS transporter [Bradyrhizobium sp. KB893862 SZCCT0404]|uniref:MFS transporter n=1 Tax=Bradyrhizobium sp. KB893862 SZCCT0404 TaxID=2807672 RepID=UPI001BAB1879|nr:MFS transporter [Bradyrhizobium sp. KB893862 SZCCT0404]MBR1176988.1 MFS transporter [Bradyrhizobium sp. KB893862 SZCCT0404]